MIISSFRELNSRVNEVHFLKVVKVRRFLELFKQVSMSFFNVVFKISLFGKTFSAGPAVIRQVIRVGMHVKFEIGHLVEGPVALVASERLLAGVNHNVISQIALLMKSLAADVANKRLLVAVGSKMSLQRGGPVETFATFVAFMRLFLRVNYLVPTQGTREAKSFPADVTYKRSTLSVVGHFKVNRQSIFGLKNFSALIAFVDSLVRAILNACIT